MNFHSTPCGTMPRDLIDISDLLDQWSGLGVPLVVSLSAPQDFGPDSDAYLKYQRLSDWSLPNSLAWERASSFANTYVSEVIQLLLPSRLSMASFGINIPIAENTPLPRPVYWMDKVNLVLCWSS